jgi:hypothetical protein
LKNTSLREKHQGHFGGHSKNTNYKVGIPKTPIIKVGIPKNTNYKSGHSKKHQL